MAHTVAEPSVVPVGEHLADVSPRERARFSGRPRPSATAAFGIEVRSVFDAAG